MLSDDLLVAVGAWLGPDVNDTLAATCSTCWRLLADRHLRLRFDRDDRNNSLARLLRARSVLRTLQVYLYGDAQTMQRLLFLRAAPQLESLHLEIFDGTDELETVVPVLRDLPWPQGWFR